MAKYKVLKTVKDKETKEVYKENEVIDVTVKRVEEFEKKHGTDYLERVEEPLTDSKK